MIERRCGAAAARSILFRDREHDARLAALAYHEHAAQRIREQDTLVHRPKEHVAKRLEIAVDRRVRKVLLRLVPICPVLSRPRLRDATELGLTPIRQEQLEPVKVVSRGEPSARNRAASSLNVISGFGSTTPMRARFSSSLKRWSMRSAVLRLAVPPHPSLIDPHGVLLCPGTSERVP